MARGTQLLQLRAMLRAEAGHSTLVSAGIDNIPSLDQKLRRTQEMLYDEYDWPFMRVKPYKALAAGSRYYDMPVEMNTERIEAVYIWYSNSPVPIERGISPWDYGNYDSDSGIRSSPVRKWDLVSTGNTAGTGAHLEQVEVWPIPSDDSQRLQFVGIRKLRPLIADSDVCDIDDLCIVLTAAAELLFGQKSQSAQRVADAASTRINQMKARTKGGSSMTSMGTGQQSRRSNLGRPIIQITSGS